MKKNFLFYAFAAICTMCMFASCSSDDDNNPAVADNVVGTYSGTLQVYGEQTFQTVKIEKMSDAQARVTLEDFSYNQIPFGDISAVCSVAEDEDGDWALNGQTTITMPGISLTKSEAQEITVTIDGWVDDEKTIELDIEVEELGISASFYGHSTAPDNYEDDEDNEGEEPLPGGDPNEDDEDQMGNQQDMRSLLYGDWKCVNVNGYKIPGSYIMTMHFGSDGTYTHYKYIPAEDEEEDTEEDYFEGTWRIEGRTCYIMINYGGELYDYAYFEIAHVSKMTMETSIYDEDEHITMTYTWEKQ